MKLYKKATVCRICKKKTENDKTLFILKNNYVGHRLYPLLSKANNLNTQNC